MTEPLPAAAGGTPRPAISRRAVVALALLTAGGLAAATSSAWLRVSTWTPLAEETVIAVPGNRAAPAVGAAAFVVATGAVALLLARGRGRLVAAAGIGLGGLLAAVAAATVLAGSEAVAVAAARSAVGVGVTTGPPTLTVAPWLALAIGVVGVVLGGCAIVVSRRWSQPTARHVPAGEGAAGDPADQWDALSRGEDPTE